SCSDRATALASAPPMSSARTPCDDDPALRLAPPRSPHTPSCPPGRHGKPSETPTAPPPTPTTTAHPSGRTPGHPYTSSPLSPHEPACSDPVSTPEPESRRGGRVRSTTAWKASPPPRSTPAEERTPTHDAATGDAPPFRSEPDPSPPTTDTGGVPPPPTRHE